MTSLRAVLFDLDDTLLVDIACIRRVFGQVCDLAAAAAPGLDAGELQRSVRRRAREATLASPHFAFCDAVGIASWEVLAADFSADAPHHAELRAWAERFRIEVWGGAIRDLGVDDGGLALELAASYAARRRSAYELFDDAVPCLEALQAAGATVGIVTNGPADLQREKVRFTGLGDLVPPDAVIVSGELGVGKPDPRPLLVACERLGVDPAQAVMVGDSRHRDVAAAHAAGCRSVWLARPGHPSTSSEAAVAPPHHILDTLAALPPLLPTLGR